MKIDLKNISQRKKTLERATRELKKHFIGIDKIIDDLMGYIQVWYLMPELLTRPVIINLWGMTGVGKTDLIRQLVKHLDFTDRFTEIELSNIDTTNYQTSVSDILSNNDLNDDKPAIVLFDEIQRFNTIDDDGNPLPQSKFTDFWELLSDGKLSKKQKDNLDQYIMQFMYNERDIQKRKNNGESHIDENPMLNHWQLSEIRKMLGNPAPLMGNMEISEKEMLATMLAAKHKKQIYEPIDHSKTLIIVSGNLDAAFSVASQTSESDIDADIFHNDTAKINLVDIKNSLSKKFRPEQVARFGNIHLIYTSLKRTHFEQLIAREITRITKNVKLNFGVEVRVDDSVATLIYNNGVFPVQGVRPVFSSIIDILETNLSTFLLNALLSNKKVISIVYNTQKAAIECKMGGQSVAVPFVGTMDKIRQSNIDDTVANISVHEAGHALVYMLLFGLAPLQLKSKVASSYAGGFTFSHVVHSTKENILKKIKVFLAGGIAEELIFGAEHASVGRANDREQATILAIDYVRRYGFDDGFQANYMLGMEYGLDKHATDVEVEKMISRLAAHTSQILLQNKIALLDISKQLSKNGSMTSAEVSKVAAQHSINATIKDENHLEIFPYNDVFK